MNLFADAAAGADAAIAFLDEGGGFLFANPAFTRFTGYLSEELSGRLLSEWILESHASQEDSPLRETVRTAGSWHGTCLQRHKNGALRLISLQLFPVRDAQGGVEGFAALLWKMPEAPETRSPETPEERYRAFFDNALEGVFQSSFDGRLIALNRAAARMHGYDSPEEFLKLSGGTDEYFWADLEERARFLEELRRNGKSIEFECQARRRDGSLFWVSLSAHIVCGEAGKPAYVIGFVLDITARRASEDLTAGNESRFMTFFERNGSVMLILDPESGVISSANHAASCFYGYAREQLIGMSINQINIDSPERLHAERMRALRAQQSHFHFRHRLSSGEVREVEAFSSPLQLGGRQMLFSIVHDITGRIRTEALLRESEENFRSTFEQAAVGILHVSIDGCVIRCNRRYAQLLGFRQEELAGMAIADIAPTNGEDMPEGSVERLKRGEIDSLSLEQRHRRKDGSSAWVKVTISTQYDNERKPLHHICVVEDINDRKLAEARLQESEERFRATFEQAAVGMVHLSLDGRILLCNKRFAQILGYEPEELIGVRTVEFDLPEYTDDNLQTLDRMADGELDAITFERRARRKDGSIVYLRVTTSIQRDSKGRLQHNISAVEDISASKQAEKRLQESEERFRSTFEQAAVGIVHVSLDDRILRCNQRFAQIHGYTQEELTGRPIAVTRAPENVESVIDLESKLIGGELETFSVERQALRKDGSRGWIRVTVSMQRDSQGAPVHRIAVVEDINDRKLAERLQQESEERYRAIFEQAAVGMVLLSPEGRIQRSNARYSQLVGYTQEELVGKSVHEIDLPEEYEQNLTTLRIMATGSVETLSFERRARRKDGSIAYFRVTGSIQCDDQKRPMHNLSVVEDITERKAAQENLIKTAEALRISEDRYRAIFETTLEAIVLCDWSERLIQVNQAFLDLTGYTREEVEGRTSIELGLWADTAQREQMFEMLQAHGKCRDYEAKHRRKNGELFWVRQSVAAITLGGANYLLAIFHDTSAEKEAAEKLTAAAEALRLSEARYRTAFETSADIIAINRISDGKYLDCNRSFLETFGYEREDVIGASSMTLNIWENTADRDVIVDTVNRFGVCRDYECRFRQKNGSLFWGRLSLSLIELNGEDCLLTVGRDISKAKLAEDEIRKLAFYDQLTQLPNRRLLHDRLRKCLATSARNKLAGAVLFIDLDNFKTLNDTLGHKTGDMLLQEAAARLMACTRESDTVARLGGDEFVVVLEELSSRCEEAATLGKTVAEKILSAISRPYRLGERECLSTCSIGIAIFGPGQSSADDIMQQADIAMYHSKNAGRNTVCFFAPELQAAVNARASTEEDLRQAITAAQFELYYQPQVANGKVIGTEALLRWRHPRRGLLAPGEFIALAEETGLILPLGEWALEEAFKQCAAWEEHNELARISVSVNISARQFQQPEFVEHVLNVLYRSGANPQKIRLELTESMLVENVDDVVTKMTQLRTHGFRFALDDFGTGYSSLAYLKRLPLDQLKIDRIFVRDILVDKGSGAIAETIVSLGKAMGLPVIAEGVETEEQLRFLERLGCHAFQGYLFGRPMPVGEFEKLV